MHAYPGLDIPDGLIYQSGKPAEGIRETLGAAMADYADEGLTFASIGLGDYSSDGETLLFTFSCKVADTAKAGDVLKVGAVLTEAVNPDDEILESVFDNDGAAVTVSGSGSSGSADSSGLAGGSADGSAGSGDTQSGSASSAAENPGDGAQSGASEGAADAPDQKQTDENGSVIASEKAENDTQIPTAGAATDNEAKGGSAWIFIVIGIAAVIAAAVIIYFLIRKKNKEKENPNGKEKL